MGIFRLVVWSLAFATISGALEAEARSSRTARPTISCFTLTSSISTSLTVPFQCLLATGSQPIAGYLVTESSTTPSVSNSGWKLSFPSYTASSTGAKTLYAWAKDSAGNISASVKRSVTITLATVTPIPTVTSAPVAPSPTPTVVSRPTISCFTLTSSTSTSLNVPFQCLLATGSLPIAGYLVTESSTAPSASASGWNLSFPSYTASSVGTKTLYAWAKDSAGNISTSVSASVTIALAAPSPTPTATVSMPVVVVAPSPTPTVTSTPTDAILQAKYYLAPNGSDTNNGSITAPFATLNKVWTVIAPGDLVYVRGGTYTVTQQQYLSGKSGTVDKMIKIWAYPGEKPKFVQGPSYTTRFAYGGTFFSGNYVHFKGLEFSGFTQLTTQIWFGFFATNASYNIFERFDLHHNSGGFRIQGDVLNTGGTSTGNLIVDSDFHHNYDPLTLGGNADGIEVAYIPAGAVNTVRNCRSWFNSDDGFDLWMDDGKVILENNWSFHNGYNPETGLPISDGIGFKLGTTSALKNQVLRVLKNNISFDNRVRGFEKNGMDMSSELFNNIAYKNGGRGYNVDNDSVHTVRNNISFMNGDSSESFSAVTIHDHNTWDNSRGVRSTDFLSLDPTGIDSPRDSNGAIPYTPFLRPAPGSALIDTGVSVGTPFNGAAPDIGPFESK